jgi:hypothetical protein
MPLALKIVIVFLLSSFMLLKAGIPAAFSFNFTFFESVTITTLGGLCGSVLYIIIWHKVLISIKKMQLKKQISSNSTPPKKFTTTNKVIVRIKKRLGLTGIAFITPLFSYPFGCFIAVKYYHKDKQKIVGYLFVSTLLWSAVLCSYKLFF